MSKITLNDVVVRYPLYGNQNYSLRRALINWMSLGKIFPQERAIPFHTALKNISLNLETGDRLGIIGRNGAGKSTLLKTIGKWYLPISGQLDITGKVTALFDVCLGMETERTGAENIYHMGMLLGMSRKYLKKAFREIADFAEVGEFLYQPVRTYSTGMKIRLGFAICTCLQPSILLLDEALGAGDIHFIEKAAARAKSFYHQADILVLASHDANIIREFCNKALWLDQGKIIMIDEVDTVLQAYESFAHPNLIQT